MRNRFLFPAILAFVVSGLRSNGQVFPNLGGQRAGISALPFLKNDLSARSLGMGGASIALGGDAFSMGVNPAAASQNSFPVIGLSTRRILPGLSQSFLGASFASKNKAVWMASLNYLSSGMQKRRTEFQPFGDGTYYSSNAWKAGLGYSKSLSRMFSFGININFIREELAQYSANAVTTDLGFLYKTDWKHLSFAVALQHFGGNSTLSGNELAVMYNRKSTNTESYGAPTLFSMGVSMIPFEQDQHQILVSAQLNHPNDNAENLRIGVQYGLDSLLYFRTGYRINVQGESVSFGLGVRSRVGAFPFQLEYAVVPNRYLGIQHSIGVSIGFHKIGQE